MGRTEHDSVKADQNLAVYGKSAHLDIPTCSTAGSELGAVYCNVQYNCTVLHMVRYGMVWYGRSVTDTWPPKCPGPASDRDNEHGMVWYGMVNG